MQEQELSNLIVALRYAAEQHSEQKRKDKKGSPYINHPIAVMETLWRSGVRDAAVLIAALLHDVVEDTSSTEEEVRSRFGNVVADLVMEVSDDKTLDQAERKQAQIEHAPHLSPAAKQIKLADKSCNLYDLVHAPPEKWSTERSREYLAWAESVVAAGLRGVNASLENHFDAIAAEARAKLAIAPQDS